MPSFVPTHDPERQNLDVAHPSQAPLLPVFVSKNLRAWPRHQEGGRAAYQPPAVALRQRYATDAHFAAYSVPALPRRLDKTALGQPLEGGPLVVLLSFLFVDVDGQGHLATDPWRQAEAAKVARVLAEHPGGFAYATRGGYRLGWRLAHPVRLAGPDDADGWRLFYWRTLLYLSRSFGIEGDPSCADWTRLYRAPHATRTEGGQPEELPSWGDPELASPLDRLPAGADLALDLEEARRLHQAHPPALEEDGKTRLAAPWGAALRALLQVAGLPDEEAEPPSQVRFGRRATGSGRPSLAERERLWCEKALAKLANDLARAVRGGRNNAARDAGLILGHYAPHLLPPEAIEAALLRACEANGLVREDGREGALTTIRRAVADGMAEPKRPDLGGDGAEAAREATERGAAPQNPPPEAPGKDVSPPTEAPRRRILVDHELHRLVQEELQTLAEAQELNLYTRNGELVQALRSTDERQGRRDAGMPYLRALPIDALWTMLVQHADFYRLAQRGAETTEAPCMPPAQSVKSLFAAGEWPGLRPLVGLLETPFLRPDGSVCCTPGYDPATGYLLLAREPFPEVPELPTHDDARQALALLQEPFCDFPFTSDASRAVPLAALMTLLARPALGPENTPCFVFDANTRGTGKSLICNVVCLLATGRPAPMTGYPASDEEMGKTLASVALGGVPLLVFDNVTTTLGGGNLDLVLTSRGVVAFRMLGAIRNQRCSWRTVVMATGNNIAIRGDTSRRVLVCEQETMAERPEDREDFRYPDLPEHVAEHRPRYVAAALTVLRAYVAAGAPRMVRPLGSFEAWSKLVAGALVWAGAANPLDSLAESSRDDDPQKAALRVLLEQWPKLDPEGDGLTVRELVAKLYPGGAPGGGWEEMREAVEVLCGAVGGKPPGSHQLARRLRTFERRVLGGRRLAQTKGHGGFSRWRVEVTRSSKT